MDERRPDSAIDSQEQDEGGEEGEEVGNGESLKPFYVLTCKNHIIDVKVRIEIPVAMWVS